MRNPFANYDSWLERPYQDAERESARQEWIAENTEVFSCCCDALIPDAISNDITADSIVRCPKCGEETEVVLVPPDMERDVEPNRRDWDSLDDY